MPIVSNILPAVKKSNHRQKRQNLENKINRLKVEIEKLYALQKEKPIRHRQLAIAKLSAKQANAQSLLNGLKKDREREREREREQKGKRVHPKPLALKGPRAKSPEIEWADTPTPGPNNTEKTFEFPESEKNDKSPTPKEYQELYNLVKFLTVSLCYEKLTKKRAIKNEQTENQKLREDNERLQTSNSNQDELISKLKKLENQIGLLEAELEAKIFDYQDYQKRVRQQNQIKDNAVRSAQKQLEVKEEIITNLEQEKEGWENQANHLTKSLLNYQQKLKETTNLLEQAQTEKDFLTKQVQELEKKISELEQDLEISDDLLGKKNSNLAQLVIQFEKLNNQLTAFKLWFPNQTSQDIARSFSKLDNQFNQVKKQARKWKKAYQQEKQNHSQTKLEKDNYQNQYQQEKTLVDSLQNGLTEKDQIIQQQAQRIRELENKPPVIETKTQEVEKEKLITNDTPFGEDLEVIKNIDLISLEKELNILLSPQVKAQIQKATNYQELSSLRNQEIKSYLEKGQQNRITSQPSKALKPNFEWKFIWIIYLVVSLAIIGSLLAKIKRIKKISKK